MEQRGDRPGPLTETTAAEGEMARRIFARYLASGFRFGPVRDRYLFSADRKASVYRNVLEITSGRARLVTPSLRERRVRWVVSIALTLGYVYVASVVFLPVFSVLSVAESPSWAGTVALVASFALWFGGLIVLLLWWDRQSLPLLADGPAGWTDLVLLGARSFGTFQEVRARTPWGEEWQLVVDCRAPRFWEAVRLLERKPAPSG